MLWYSDCNDCKRACPRHSDPICATNGFTQSNPCELAVTTCRTKGEVTAAFRGECPMCPPGSPIVTCAVNPCHTATCYAHPNAKCLPTYCGACKAEFFSDKGEKINCEVKAQKTAIRPGCPMMCTADYRPVCASNGNTYPNECSMRASACSQQITLRKLWDGECGSCEIPCTRELKPICATNGFTQSNKCALKIQMCKSKGKVQKAYDGECPKCPPGTPMPGCLKDPCLNAKCPAHPDAKCVPFICGGCNALFFDAAGKKLTCEAKLASDVKDCPQLCTADFRPVCGSDGKTYANECNMKSTACRKKITLKKLWDGECGSCEISCTRELDPICATNGFTQSNRCELKIQMCKSKGKVQKAYDGECPKCPPGTPMAVCRKDPCLDAKCPAHPDAKCVPYICEGCKALFFNADGKKLTCEAKLASGIKDCPQVCPAIFRPVCGSDGKTYPNECNMKSTACRDKITLKKIWDGECGNCERACTRDYRPICATSGLTASNKCALMVTMCKTKGAVRKAFDGECPSCPKGSPISQCKMNPCVRAKCTLHPTATCVPSFCGGCNALFYDSMGKQVACDNAPIGKIAAPARICPLMACMAVLKPVCGSDGETYPNECEMRISRCKTGKLIKKLWDGKCDDCKRPCTKEYKPVCGTNGFTKSNMCEMKNKICSSKGQVQLAFEKPCPECDKNSPIVSCLGNPCETEQCMSHRSAVCLVSFCGNCKARFYNNKGEEVKCSSGNDAKECPTACPFNYDPVCGSDDVTYSNLCVMKAESCRKGLQVSVKKHGPCVADCVTPCPKLLRPVCGTDGETYNNECLLKIASCKSKGTIQMAFAGVCESCETGTPVATCDGNPCENARCANDKDARCVVSRCGTCKATFFRANGKEAVCGSTVKPGSCPVPKVFGGCGNLCETDKECGGTDKCCSNGCGKWCIKSCPECVPCPPDMETVLTDVDDSGCRPCKCRRRCPMKRCRMICPNGYRKNSRGCPLCMCKSIAPPPMPTCPLDCPNGIVFRFKFNSGVECVCKP